MYYSFLGTLRPDLIESASSLASNKAVAIKTHHNDTDFVRALRAQVSAICSTCLPDLLAEMYLMSLAYTSNFYIFFNFSREELLNRYQSFTKMKSELWEKSWVYQQISFTGILSLVSFCHF